MTFLPHVIDHVQSNRIPFGGSHHENLGRDFLLAEIEDVGRLLSAASDFFRRDVRQCLAGAHRGAHGPLADGSTVIAHIAFHHLLLEFHHLGNTERAGNHTVAACDAARLQGRVDNSVVAFLDGISRTHLSAGWFIAVPANVGCRGDALSSLDEIEVDHRFSPMRLALLASLETGAASDATRRVDVELVAEHYAPPREAPL